MLNIKKYSVDDGNNRGKSSHYIIESQFQILVCRDDLKFIENWQVEKCDKRNAKKSAKHNPKMHCPS